MVGDGWDLNIGDTLDVSPPSCVKVVVGFDIVRTDEMLTPLSCRGGEELLKCLFSTGEFARVQ